MRSRTKPDVSTEKDQITQEATRAILHKDTHGGCGLVNSFRHFKLQILQRCGLRYLPMNTGRVVCLSVISIAKIHECEVENKVPDLTIGLVLIDVPLVAIAAGDVNVSVY